MSYDPCPVDTWGKDHWSTLAYIETRFVDHRGRLDYRHMRGHLGDQYPTMLAGGERRAEHNDFDCVADMIAYGLLTCDDDEINDPPYRRRQYRRMLRLMADGQFTVAFTPLGQEVALDLRAHKAGGGSFARYQVPKSMAFRARLQEAAR